MGRAIEVQIIGDASRLQRAFGDAEKSAGSFGGRMKTLGGVAGKAAIALGAGAGLGLAWAVHDLAGDMIDGQKASSQTSAVLKSTGDVANVTKSHVEDLATAIQRKSGMDDAAVQSGENMLLTFTNIRNEVGRGNNVFDQATTTLADMSQALGQDMSKSAIQLGKALNDPIKGVSALQRVGVTFTAGQKATIKAMVESGNTMGAQKLILHELNREFGGSAEAAGKTLPGQLNILKGQFENVAESVLSKVLPSLLQVTTWVNQHGPEIASVMSAVSNAVRVTFTTVLIPAAQLVIQATQAIATAVRTHWAQISSTISGVVNTIKTIFTGFETVAKAIWARFGGAIVTIVRTDFGIVKTVVTTVLENIATAIKLIGDLIHGRWSNVWDDMKTIVTRTLKAVVTVISGMGKVMFTAAKAFGSAILDGIVAGLSKLGSMLVDAIIAPINAIIRRINGIHISLPKIHIPFVGDVGGGSIGFNIPTLGDGGIVTSPTLALIGEKGPEAIVPLGKGGYGGGITVNVNHPVVLNGQAAKQITEIVRAELIKIARSQGGTTRGLLGTS